jgi:hypothetical protein
MKLRRFSVILGTLLASIPLVSAQTVFEPGKVILDLLGFLITYMNTEAAVLGGLILATWLLVYGATLLGLKKAYRGELSREIKIIAGSLSFIVISGFFFTASGSVIDRAKDLVWGFNGLAAIILSLVIFITLKGMFQTLFGWQKFGSNTAAGIIAFLMYGHFAAIGLSGSGSSPASTAKIIGYSSGGGIAGVLILALIIKGLSTMWARKRGIPGSSWIRRQRGLENKEGRPIERFKKQHFHQLLDKLSSTFGKGISDFDEFKKLQDLKREFLKNAVTYYEDMKDYPKVFNFFNGGGKNK